MELGCVTEPRDHPPREAHQGGAGVAVRPGDPAAVECPVRVIKVLRVASEADAETWARLRLDPPTLAVLETVIERELEHHLDRRLRSWEVLRALER